MTGDAPHRVTVARAAGWAALKVVTISWLAGVFIGCAIKPPPPATEIRDQALRTMNVNQPWVAGDASTEAAAKVEDNWLESFSDPALDQLVREAIANNPDLRVAAARVEQAGQHLVIAQSALRPAIAIAGTGGTKAGGGSDPTSALQGALIAASWEVDLWGRARYARNAAREAYASSRADLEFARQSLAASTAKAWFTATQLTLHASIAARMVESARLLQSLAETRERIGAGAGAETAVAQAAALDAENTLQQVQFARGQALRALELIIGRYPAADLSARPELAALPSPPDVGIPLQTLERRPDVIAAERRVAAAFNRVGEAKAARLPQITLNLNFGAFDSEILELKEGYKNPSGGIGARLLAPIYQGGALQAQVQIRNLQQQEAIADYARIALRAIGEVENALAASESLATRVALLTEAMNRQTRALEFTRERVRIGRADQRALEQQRLQVDIARIELLDAHSDALAERVNLHLALGGSFEPVAP